MNAGDQYGDVIVSNEDVVVVKDLDDRGPPKTWFGFDESQDGEQAVPKKVIDMKLPILHLRESRKTMCVLNCVVLCVLLYSGGVG